MPNKFLLISGGILILLIIVFLIIANMRIYQKREQLISRVEILKNKIEGIKSKNNDLIEGISNANNDQYTEKIAREELDLQKPGEKVFSFIKAPNEQQQKNENQKNIFQDWLGWISQLFKK